MADSSSTELKKEWKTTNTDELFNHWHQRKEVGLRTNTNESRSVVSNSLQPDGLWNSPSQNTGVGILSLLQAISPTQGSNPGLLHCRKILYPLSHNGSPKILEWVAYLFSSGSSQPRNWTRVSWIADGFFINWPIREAQEWTPSAK